MFQQLWFRIEVDAQCRNVTALDRSLCCGNPPEYETAFDHMLRIPGQDGLIPATPQGGRRRHESAGSACPRART